MSDCIEAKHVHQSGYGRAWLTRKRDIRAHRLAWIQKWGWLPDGLYVCHRCNNKRCINVDHLYLGTAAVNNRDAIADGLRNAPKGEKHWSTNLTEDDVRAIRSDTRTQKEIAEKYGMDQSAVSLIKRRKRWGHVV